MDADLICLQEVQVDLWPDFMERLQPLYDGILQNVTRGHNVASALLIRKTCPLQVERFESRSRVLLAVLKDPRKQEKDSKLYLCSVHLEAGEDLDADETRFYQVQSLFRRLRYHCQLDGTKLEDAPIVLAGDFNMLRTNLMHCDLSRGELHNPGQMRNKPPISTIPLHDAYLEDSTTSSTMPSSPSSNYSGRASKVQYPTEDRTPKELVKTYARGYVLDYVFTSGKVDVQETLLLHPGASRKEAQKWPSREYPSDHLPIGIDLEWE
jgi:endonuclease/exonuclease/phosphatase family metal-dependent hydrolase